MLPFFPIDNDKLTIESQFPIVEVIIDPDKDYPLINRVSWLAPTTETNRP